MALFLPTSTIDDSFHALSNACSTLVSRNRLPGAVWASLPYAVPLAMLPAVVAPAEQCVALLSVAGALHAALACVHVVFRPHSILFVNACSATALVVTAVLVWCTAAIAHSPDAQAPRDIADYVGKFQIALTAVRLVHSVVVSVVLPLLMRAKLMRRPERMNVGDECRNDTVPTPLWVVHAPYAPNWFPVGALEGGLLADLLAMPDLAGPQTVPRPLTDVFGDSDESVEMDDDERSEHDEVVTPTNTPSSDDADLDGDRVRNLLDPCVNPMALMHSTANAIAQLKREGGVRGGGARRIVGFRDRQAAMYDFLDSNIETAKK